MAKLIPLGNNRGNENRPSDEELNQMFDAFMDAFFGGLSDEDIDEESDDDIIPFDEFDDSLQLLFLFVYHDMFQSYK
jgi:hypothetical protein